MCVCLCVCVCSHDDFIGSPFSHDVVPCFSSYVLMIFPEFSRIYPDIFSGFFHIFFFEKNLFEQIFFEKKQFPHIFPGFSTVSRGLMELGASIGSADAMQRPSYTDSRAASRDSRAAAPSQVASELWSALGRILGSAEC